MVRADCLIGKVWTLSAKVEKGRMKMTIKNFQESKGGVNPAPTTKRPSPPKGMDQNEKPVLLELKSKDGVQYLTNDMGVECIAQIHNSDLKNTEEIAKTFGVPEEFLKGVDEND